MIFVLLPTYKVPPTPTPPATVNAPVVVDVAGVIADSDTDDVVIRICSVVSK